MKWEAIAPQFQGDVAAFAARRGLSPWEVWYAPYDPAVYAFVLERLQPEDVVLDIGAGDFRLALAAARRVRKVYAVEVHPTLVANFLHRMGAALPSNLQVVCANALEFPFPSDVTAGILLVRHSEHFADFFSRLRAVGAQRLFTNARWHMGVELVDLQAPRMSLDAAPPGWYACACGAVGFKEPASWDDPYTETVHEVATCPRCRASKEQSR